MSHITPDQYHQFDTDNLHYITDGTPESSLLKKVREANFKPIGITVMMCEETFIFRTVKEALAAWDMFAPNGWWYDISGFITYRKKYIEDNYDGVEIDAPIVHWFDHNYEPKNNT